MEAFYGNKAPTAQIYAAADGQEKLGREFRERTRIEQKK
jgi:hypothetical protein